MEPGTKLAHFEVLSLLGKGGMGEVWRAQDTKLGREVAIKTLPDEFPQDADRLARFEREAKLLASLNHPNIAAIYGLEEHNGTCFLVLELVEGPTLEDRVKQRAIPIEESLNFALQIAEALEAAHEKGVVHRDLKPANVKLTADGKVKVLDFGLAKAWGDGGIETDLSNSPTLSMAATERGVILGTAAYMSPEQARGEDVDKRADIWAFGCVLFEMLSGRSTFDGKTLTDLLASVLKSEPDWTRLPRDLHPRIRLLLERCLEKDARNRYRDVGDARVDLQEVLSDPEGAFALPTPQRRGGTFPRVAVIVTALAVAAAAGWTLRPFFANQSAGAVRTSLSLPPNQQLVMREEAYPLALSPDGSSIVYAAWEGGTTSLYLRTLKAFEARALPGTEGARYPFFSPDGQWIGFFAGNRLQKVNVEGGAPLPIADVPNVGRGGATWGPDNDTIVFSAGSQPGLWRVSSGGGTPEPITEPNAAAGELSHTWPQFLPDGRNLTFSLGNNGSGGLGLLSLDTGEWRPLIDLQAKQARYVSSGHLVYAQEGALRAFPFDLKSLTVTGSPVPLLDPVFDAPNSGGSYFAISASGSLVYVSGGVDYTLVWVDRAGQATQMTEDRKGFRLPDVSPDGTQIAVTVDPPDQGQSDTWIYDVRRGVGRRLTFEGHNLIPVWKPDGSGVASYTARDIWWYPTEGGSDPERLLAGDHPMYPTSWFPDGSKIAFHEDEPDTQEDIWVLSLDANRTRTPIVNTPYREFEPQFSPDGRWLAYRSDESGRNEIYVLPYLGPGERVQVSVSGGTNPIWSSDGRELFYRNGPQVIAVPILTGDGFEPGPAQILFENGSLMGSGANLNFDVASDAERFLMIQSGDPSRGREIRLVQNWFEELKERVPTP